MRASNLRNLVAVVGLALVGLPACGPKLEPTAKVEDGAVVVRGRVSRARTADVLVRAAGAKDVVKATRTGDTFEARMPLHALAPGSRAFEVSVAETEHSTPLRTVNLDVTVPDHAALAIVGCGGAAREPGARLQGDVRVDGDDVQGSVPLCPIVDGRVALSVLAPPGLVVDGGEGPKTVPADGKLDVEISVLGWLGGIAVDAVATRYEDGEPVRANVARTLVPHVATLNVRLGAVSRSSAVRIGAGYERDPGSERSAIDARRRALVGLAERYIDAARHGRVAKAPRPALAGTALVVQPARQSESKYALPEPSSLSVFGDAMALADVERFAVAERMTTGKTIERCGPYEKQNGEPGSWTVPRVRVDARLTAWSRSGEPLRGGIVRGGERGCPAILFGLETSYDDAPTVVQLGSWLLTDSG